MARILANVIIDINSNFIKRRSNFSSKVSSRSTSVTSNTSFISYYEKIEINNNLSDKKVVDPLNSFQLLYKDDDKASNSVRKAVDNSLTKNLQYVQNKALVCQAWFILGVKVCKMGLEICRLVEQP